MYADRNHVEIVGTLGVAVEKDELGTRARQLDSFWLYLDEDDHGYVKHAKADGYWEAWITLWMDKNVPVGSTVLDIGANHGYYSFMLADHKGCEVYAVEPQRKLASLIRKSEEYNNLGVTVIEQAVSDKAGSIQMMVPINHGMNATISNEFTFAPNGYETIAVETFALDTEPKFDFIKVDAEGAEDLIWAGSAEYRSNFPDTLWLMEWRWDRYKDPAGFAEDLFADHVVTHVNFDGTEEPVEGVDHLATVKDADWMLVLRSK